nr:MAG TPA: hypothetical protein [Bacteriophage sp.]
MLVVFLFKQYSKKWIQNKNGMLLEIFGIKSPVL